MVSLVLRCGPEPLIGATPRQKLESQKRFAQSDSPSARQRQLLRLHSANGCVLWVSLLQLDSPSARQQRFLRLLQGVVSGERLLAYLARSAAALRLQAMVLRSVLLLVRSCPSPGLSLTPDQIRLLFLQEILECLRQ